ncbi:MAG: YidC/Oxa1 family membrane protein insertase [Dehalococcoidia bacterium]
MEAIGTIFNEIFLRPLLNSLVFLYNILGNNFGLAIIAFTIIIRILILPLTMRQLRSTRAMMGLQPKVQELQKKFKGDRQRISQETMRLYKEEGINPIGCLGPTIIQLPIWIGLYRAILQALPSNPEGLVDFSQKLYSWLPGVHEAVPLNRGFLWLDLGETDPARIVMPVLVGGSMWVLQRMSTTGAPAAGSSQASMNRMMQWMMPIMFGMFTFQFPSGLALYWVVSNLIGIAFQYRVTGWGAFRPAPTAITTTGVTVQAPSSEPAEELEEDAGTRDEREDSGRGHRDRAKTARRRQRRSRHRRR